MTNWLRLATLVALLLGVAGAVAPAGARTDTYTYDGAGRLVEARLGDVLVAYEYDAAGNLLTRQVPEPGAGPIALAAVAGLAWLRRRRRGARLLPFALAVVATVAAPQLARAQCDPIDPPFFTSNVAASPGGSTTLRVQCDELCTFTASVSPDPGPFSVSPEMIQIGPGVPFDFLLLAGAEATDGQRSSVFLQFSCPSGGSSFDYRAYVQAIDNQTIEDKGGGTDADPVSTRNGELFKSYPPDLDLGGPLRVHFQRYYASNLLTDARTDSRLGDNWLHNFRWELQALSREAVLTTPSGRTVRFLKQGGDWVLIGPTAIPFQLVDDDATNGTTLYDPRTGLFYEFSAGDTLLSIADANGNTLSLAYSLPGPGLLQLDSVSDGLGRTLTFTYLSGLMKSVSDGTRTVSFDHTGTDLTSVTDAAGHVTTFAYAAGALLATETRPEANVPFTQTWGTGGGGTGAGAVVLSRVVDQTNAGGDSVTFGYASDTTTLTDALGSRVHVHDATGELTSSTDRAGQSVAIALDDDGRRASVTDRLGDETRATYDATSGKRATVTHADGAQSQLAYSSRTVAGLEARDLTGVVNADGTTEVLAYDGAGNLASRTDAAGGTSTASYDGTGQLLTATNAEGGTTTRTYGADGTLATHSDAAGNTTTVDYDAMRRPSLVTYGDARTVSLAYDENDRVTSRTDERGSTASVVYDDNGNPTNLIDPFGSVDYLYDGNDRVTSRTDRTGRSASVTYDGTGRIASSTDEGGHTTHYGYDTRGRLDQVMRPMGNTLGLRYDAEGVVAAVADGLGEEIALESDAMGRITLATTPRGNAWAIDFDLMGRPSLYVDPTGGETAVEREPRGGVSAITLPGGMVRADYEYDGLGNLDRIWDPNGQAWDRAHDASGRPSSRTDPLGQTTSITYDARNRISGLSFFGDLGDLQIARDETGNPTGLTGADGTNVTLGYDPAGRPTSGTGLSLTRDAEGRVTDSNGIVITYDAAGLPETVTLAPGVTLTYGYDANGRVVTVEDSLGGGVVLSYDANDNITAIIRSNGTTTVYSYDEDGALVGIDEGSFGDTWLTRDPLGRISGAVRTGIGDEPLPIGAIWQGFDAASQTLGVDHDELGRVTQDGMDSYQWSLGGPLWSYTRDGTTTSSTYDALGNRTSRTRGGEMRDYVWNYGLGLPGLSIEREGGQDRRYYVHLPFGELLYRIDPVTGDRTFYHFTETGDTSFLTDDAGQMLGQYRYSPFGRIDLGETLDEPFTYRGQIGGFEDAPGLHLVPSIGWYDADRARTLERQPDTTAPLLGAPYGVLGADLLRRPSDIGVPRVPEVIQQVQGPRIDRRPEPMGGSLGVRARGLGMLLLGELELEAEMPATTLRGFQPAPFVDQNDIPPILRRLQEDLLLFAAALQGTLPFQQLGTGVSPDRFPLAPQSHREAANKPELAEPRPGAAPSLRAPASF